MKTKGRRKALLWACVLIALTVLLLALGYHMVSRSVSTKAVDAVVEHWDGGAGLWRKDAVRIVMVKTHYPKWVFKIARGHLNAETIIAYGTIDERTLDVDVTDNDAGPIAPIFFEGSSARLWAEVWPRKPLSEKELGKRAANLGRIRDPLTKTDLEGGTMAGLFFGNVLWELAVEWDLIKAEDSCVVMYMTLELETVTRPSLTFNVTATGGDGPPGFSSFCNAGPMGYIDLDTLVITDVPEG